MRDIYIEESKPKSIPNWVRDPRTPEEVVKKFYMSYWRKVGIDNLDPAKEGRELALTYAEVFAGPPWNEYTKCNETGKYFGRETRPGEKCGLNNICADCKGRLRLAYPLRTTLNYILGDSRKEGYDGKTIKEGFYLAGFAWGYTYQTAEAFANEKYCSDQMRYNLDQILKDCGLTGSFFYFSECGIRLPYRKKGLSNVLFEETTSQARNLGLGIVMRTNCQSPMVAVANRFGMKQVLGPKVELNPSREYVWFDSKNPVNSLDTENPNRVLFIMKG